MVFHQPVLTSEVLHWLNLKEHGIYCDCTVGGGGHLLAMLCSTRHTRFIGIDWDPEAIAYTRQKIAPYLNRTYLVESNFIYLDRILKKLGITTIDGTLFDLGPSYYQLTTPDRGFSFEREGQLLMQMSPQSRPLLQKIASITKPELTTVLREYGDLTNAKLFATVIYENRSQLQTTLDLRRLIEKNSSPRFLKKNLHKIFQALRIWVNDELSNLEKGLFNAINLLSPHARILVISYHSGEDRIVKNTFRDLEKEAKLRRLHKKVFRPTATEIRTNPAARSAKMRVAERCG